MIKSNPKTKNIILGLVVLIIVFLIWYLESKKPVVLGGGLSTGKDLLINTASSSKNTLGFVSDRSSIVEQKNTKYSKAKEIQDPQGFVNSAPFTLSNIAGKKVILLDFWTYSCINCQRTIPYLNAWYKKYKDLGLEIVGIHTPEFDFEKDYNNVSKAVSDLGIRYPVVLDSNQGTWNAYANLYWPHEYLVDIDGFIVHDHIGEGSYSDTEQAIQNALKERSDALGLGLNIPTSIVSPSDAISLNQSRVGSQETYFGSDRNVYLENGKQGTTGSQSLLLPTNQSGLKYGALYLGGVWNFTGEYAENTSATAKILYHYDAKNVYFVASGDSSILSGTSSAGVPIKIFQDGKLINTMIIKSNKLYTLIQGSDYGQHDLEIEVDGSGLQAFTFTFG